MREDNVVVNDVLGPMRGFKPNHAIAVSTTGKDVGPAVAVDVGRGRVRGADLPAGPGQKLPAPRLSGIFRSVKDGEVISVGKGFSFGAESEIRTTIAVDVAKIKVVAATRGSSFCNGNDGPIDRCRFGKRWFEPAN